MHYCTHCRKNLVETDVKWSGGGESATKHHFCPHCGEPTAWEQVSRKYDWLLFLLLLPILFLWPDEYARFSLIVVVGFLASIIYVVKLLVEDRLKQESFSSEFDSTTTAEEQYGTRTDMAVLVCACGHRIQAKSTLADRHYTCPRCGRRDYAPRSLWK